MKKLTVEADVENYFEDFLYPGHPIETKEDEELFVKSYNFVLSELERMQWYPHAEYDPHAEYELHIMLENLDKIAENSGYEIDIDFDTFKR